MVNSRLSSAVITDSGSGYTSVPTVTISSPTLSLSNFTATATAVVDSTGQIGSYNMTNAGSFYLSVPTVTVGASTGGADSFKASALAVMDNVDSNHSVSRILILDSGSGYETLPTIIIDSSAGTGANFQAKAVGVRNTLTRKLLRVDIINQGKYYDSNIVPGVTIAAPRDVKFDIGEKITHKLPNTTLHGEISAWKQDSNKLSIIHVGADDGTYHEFIAQNDSDIVGLTNGSKVGIVSVIETNKISNNEQNDDFAATSTNVLLDFLDFSETNPFGDPGDT